MSSKKFKEAIQKLQSGQFSEGKKILEKLNRKTPNDYDILYNLGMTHSELDELKSAEKCLKKCISINPDHSNAYVALGLVYHKKGEIKDAEQYLDRALILEPDNPYANKNLGSILGSSGKIEKAIDCFQKALIHLENDAQLHYGIGLAYQKLGDSEQTRHHLNRTISLAPSSQIAELAKKEINSLGQEKIETPKEQIVQYCINALKYYDEVGVRAMKQIVAEIAILGNSGLKYENSYSIKSMSGEFTGLELIAYMYVGLQEIAPGEDAGIDLSIEYKEALNQYSGS